MFHYEFSRRKGELIIYAVKGGMKIRELCQGAASITVEPIQMCFFKKFKKNVREKNWETLFSYKGNYYYISCDNNFIARSFVDTSLSRFIEKYLEVEREKNLKTYIEDKNFLPIEYVNDKVRKDSKDEKRGLYILIITALILLPFLLRSINTKEEVKIENVEYASANCIKKDEVIFWLSLNKNGVKGNIVKNNASLEVINNETLEQLSKDDKVSINNIYYLGDDKYKIELIKR